MCVCVGGADTRMWRGGGVKGEGVARQSVQSYSYLPWPMHVYHYVRTFLP